MELIQIMKKVELFRDLSDQQLDHISKISHQEDYVTGDKIFSQGDPGNKMYIIGEGEVEIVVQDTQGNTYSAVYLGEGQVVGEMSLIDEGTRSASVVASQDKTKVYSIQKGDFTRLCESETDIGYLMMRNIAQDLSFKLRRQDANPS
jgi:CRP-like cAMP-binding protein